MDVITLDFETYYDKQFSLSKLTTEQYIRSADFEIIGVSVKVNNGDTAWLSGKFSEIKEYLHKNYNWGSSAVLAHNTMFDGAILSWILDIHPKLYLDTLCMARALHGVEAGGSLKALSEMYDIGEKGDEVINALGKRRKDFTDAELDRYGDYCVNDVEMTYKLFNIFLTKRRFPKAELKVIDLTLRMFIDPVLELDMGKLQDHLDNLKVQKDKLLEECGIDKEELMSNPKFAKALGTLGVTPPMKTSLRTGKETFAFAKSDEAFKALQEHEDPRVQALVAARLGVKSTLEETRTERFLDIALRGTLPVPIKYYAAHTGRWGGLDKINLQNLPSRGENAKVLKSCIVAPKGYTLVQADSAQIEARVLAWLAGQDDLVKAFEKGEDVYKKMAAAIYDKPVTEVTDKERFVGKTTILGCIAEGTLVLCESGWKPIETVSVSDRVWDGEEWVCHQGLLKKGYKETVELCGSWLTPDHKILCGAEWKEVQSVVQDVSIRYQALATGAANLPSQAMYGGYAEVLKPSLCSAAVEPASTLWTTITSRILSPHGAMCVLKSLLRAPANCIGGIAKYCKTMHIGSDYLTVFPAAFPAVTTLATSTTRTTAAEVSKCSDLGVRTVGRFCNTLYRLCIGTTPSVTLIGSTTPKDTSRVTYGSQQEQRTHGINVKSAYSRRNLMTYDIAYAGPRNRFTIATSAGPVIAHNCGYGMGAVKFREQLKTLGVEIEQAEAERIIHVYRNSNDAITTLWKQAQTALMRMYQDYAAELGRKGVLEVVPNLNSIRLPSGLMMYYNDLQAEENEKGVQFSYKTRQGRVKIYGGKVIENACQGIARCVMSDQMLKITAKYPILLTVHDSVVCCVRDTEVEEAATYVDSCMRWTPDWAKGLPVRGDVETGKTYGDCTKWIPNQHGRSAA